MPNLYDIIMGDEPNAQEQARTMADALRGQRRTAELAMLIGTGNKGIGSYGQAVSGDAGKQEAQLADAAGTRLQQAIRAKQLAQQAQAQQAEQGFRRSQLGLQQQEVDIRKQQLEQENWAAIADPVTGGIVAYNRKTGETRPLGPGGGRPGVSPTVNPVPGEITPLPGIPGKPTEAQRKAVLEKSQSIAGLDLSIDALKKAPRAYGGIKNFAAGLAEQMGGTPAQTLLSRRYSPEELRAKNQISNVVSAIINQRAGANVTYREELRQKFLPQDTDSGEAALQKLMDLRDFETTAYEAQGAGLVPPVRQQKRVIPIRKNIGGKTYEKREDGWYEAD